MRMLFAIAAVLALVVVIVIGVSFKKGFFKIEKVEVDGDATAELSFPAGDAGEENDEAPSIALDDGVSLKEKMEKNGVLDTGGENDSETAVENAKSTLESTPGMPARDPLSELPIGRGYLIDCQRQLTDAMENGYLYAAAWFDLDRFRFINSLKGQSIGDYVISRIGQELPSIFPEESLFTRVSADHFTVVFPVTDSDMFAICDERLRELCERLRGDIAFKTALRIHIGFATTESKRDYDVSILLQKANIARFCIKQSRDESWKLFDDNMIATYLYGESAVEYYSENQFDSEFTLYFSPQQDIVSRRFIGCEVLPRWACEDGDSGVPRGMGKNKIPCNNSKLIYLVCKHMSRWRKNGKQVLQVSVAVPPTELFKEDFDELLGRCVSEFQLEPSMLAIIIEASVLRMDATITSRQIRKIRELGVLVGIDEIDTGYSDLDFLSDTKVDLIKLHRSFLADLESGAERRNNLKHMLESAEQAGMRVILEGVDRQGQADILKGMGGREIQGMYSGRLLTSEEYAAGLPDYVEKRLAQGTVILDDIAMNKGDFQVF